MEAVKLLAIGLLVLGVLINLVPMASYFFKTYLPTPYKGTFTKGVSLIYYGVINTNSTVAFPFKLNVTNLGNGKYLVNLELYKLRMEPGVVYSELSDFFEGATEIYAYNAITNSSSYPFLKILFPEGNEVEVKEQNMSLNFTISNYTTWIIGSFVGIPFSHVVGSFIQYVDYGSQNVMYELDTLSSSSSVTKLLVYLIFPNYNWNSNISFSMIYIELETGNAVPSQDWLQWLKLGLFLYAFPINIILIIAGAVLAIYYYRRV